MLDTLLPSISFSIHFWESQYKWFLISQVGPKKAREMWFLARFYTAEEAEKMGLVNTVVPVSLFVAYFMSLTKCQAH